MVCEWGMSDKLGPLAYEKREGPVFLGMQNTQARDYSDAKAQEIDAEVFTLITNGHNQAVKILKEHMTALNNMTGALLEYETIDADEVNLLVQGGTLEQMKAMREQKIESIARDRKLTADADAALPMPSRDVKKVSGGGDPVGQPGPATA